MTSPEEEKAWRLIVDHYDETATPERPTLTGGQSGEGAETPGPDGGEPSGAGTDAEPTDGLPTDPQESRDPLPPADPFPRAPYVARPEESEPEPQPAYEKEEEEESFTLPPPPPAPKVPTGRRVAWAAVGGAPLVFLVAALTGNALPGTAAALLGVALAVGFVYLVLTMPSEPRDPWDDGSRV